MPLKQLSEFKRNDYTYVSPDGDEFDITIIQTGDRKYVEIKRGEDTVRWDVEMLLDIHDAVRQVMRDTPSKRGKHKLKGPNVIDHRDHQDQNLSPPEAIQSSVDASMKKSDPTVMPVESFSAGQPPSLVEDIKERKKSKVQSDAGKIKKVAAKDLM